MCMWLGMSYVSYVLLRIVHEFGYITASQFRTYRHACIMLVHNIWSSSLSVRVCVPVRTSTLLKRCFPINYFNLTASVLCVLSRKSQNELAYKTIYNNLQTDTTRTHTHLVRCAPSSWSRRRFARTRMWHCMQIRQHTDNIFRKTIVLNTNNRWLWSRTHIHTHQHMLSAQSSSIGLNVLELYDLGQSRETSGQQQRQQWKLVVYEFMCR